VWDENRKERDVPLGKVTLSKDFFLQKKKSEQWFQLASAQTEGTVTGEVHLQVQYYPASPEVPACSFSVTVLEARNLVPRDRNGFFFFFFDSLWFLDLASYSSRLLQVPLIPML